MHIQRNQFQEVLGDDLQWLYLDPRLNGLASIFEGFGMEIFVRRKKTVKQKWT